MQSLTIIRTLHANERTDAKKKKEEETWKMLGFCWRMWMNWAISAAIEMDLLWNIHAFRAGIFIILARTATPAHTISTNIWYYLQKMQRKKNRNPTSLFSTCLFGLGQPFSCLCSCVSKSMSWLSCLFVCLLLANASHTLHAYKTS